MKKVFSGSNRFEAEEKWEKENKGKIIIRGVEFHNGSITAVYVPMGEDPVPEDEEITV